MAVAEATAVSSDSASTSWLRDLVTLVGSTVGTYLLTMLAWVIIPTLLLGWSPMVVVSGSMEPLISAGDVVVVEQVDGLAGPGTVVAFEDGSGVVVHRVVDVDDDGVYTTKGDASPRPDPSQTHQRQLIGQGRLVVPYIGLAHVAGVGWWIAPGVLAAMSLLLPRRRTGLVVAVVIAMLALTGVISASAAFTQTTANGSSSITAVDVEPPSDLTAACGLIGEGDVLVDLAWGPSPTAGLSGYRILHDGPAAGVNFTEVGTTGPGTTTFTHTITVALLGLGTHTYAVQGLVDPWESENSNTDAVSVTQIVAYICTEL